MFNPAWICRSLSFVSCVVLFCVVGFLLSGCTSDADRMMSICTDVEAAALQTDDCDAMARKLAPVSKDFSRQLDKIRQSEPSQTEKQRYLDSVSTCMRAYLEISLGPCGQNRNVQSAFPQRDR